MEPADVNSTKAEVERFIESVLWADIIRELEGWREGFRAEMESIVEQASDDNPSTASVLLHMGDLNGRMKAVTYVLEIPDMFLSIIESKKEEVEDERSGQDD